MTSEEEDRIRKQILEYYRPLIEETRQYLQNVFTLYLVDYGLYSRNFCKERREQ